MRSLRPVQGVIAALATVACAFAATPAAAQLHDEGAIGPGSLYEIDVPSSWNGDLVVYAHGLVPAELPVIAPSGQEGFPLIRATLLAGGYAVAASSFSTNGWAVADAVRRTHQLSGIFTSKVGRARRTFLLGASMGALVVVQLAEQHAGQYDGALALCGPVGGAQAELQYAGDVRVLFDHYFPGVLPGTAFAVPPGTDYRSWTDPGGPSPLFLQVVNALAADPLAVSQWATAARLPFSSEPELLQSALYSVGFVLRFANDFSDRVNGKIAYDNSTTQYQVNVPFLDAAANAGLSALLNSSVLRVQADPAALNYYARHYQPTGDIGAPVVTLHTTRDPAIPYAHEQLFADAVAAAGRSDLLLQIPIDAWGHCNFAPADVQSALATLVSWATTGQKP